jgi:hypothetical protein
MGIGAPVIGLAFHYGENVGTEVESLFLGYRWQSRNGYHDNWHWCWDDVTQQQTKSSLPFPAGKLVVFTDLDFVIRQMVLLQFLLELVLR